MHCPKCRIKLMVDERMSSGTIKARCMKCGSEFSIHQGRIQQKKIKKTKTVKKKVIISRPDMPLSPPHADLIKQHKRIQEQVDQVRRLNEHAKRIRHNR